MSEHFVPTRCALMRKDAASDFKVVTYESRKPAKKEEKAPGPAATGEERDARKGIDIQRARREIIKFGISGFSHEKQQEAKVALAISLGARPAKRECKNYKKLLEEKARQARLDRKYAALQQAGKNALGVSTARKKFVFNKALDLDKSSQYKKNKADILQVYGKATIDTTPSKPSANSARARSKNKRHKRNGKS